MGNTSASSATTGDRGRPLGSGPTSASSSSQALQAREARSRLVKEKTVHKSEIARKERILGIVDGTSTVEAGSAVAPAAATSVSSGTGASSSASSLRGSSRATSSVVATVDPATVHGAKALARVETKLKKSERAAIESKRDRTKDLLFGDGLKEPEFVPSTVAATTSVSASSSSGSRSGGSGSGTVTDPVISSEAIPVSRGGAASAALARMTAKSSREASMAARKERTKELLHGDELTDKRASEAVLKDASDSVLLADLPPGKARVQQSLLNLQNLNPHSSVPPTARLLRKIVTNLLSADTLVKQEKVGKLRLSNDKIRERFVDLVGGIECLNALGFDQKTIEQPSGIDEEFMIFDFSRIDQELSDDDCG